jgi:hypothetical protein
MPSVVVDRWVKRYVARLQFGEFLKAAADLGTVFLLALGGIVLAVKLALPVLWPHVLWLWLGGLVVTAGAWWSARRHRWGRRESVAHLDRSLEAGGLLMTLVERPDEDWAAHLPHLEQQWSASLPRLAPRRFCKRLALPALFAVAACWIPLRLASSNTSPRPTVAENAADELQEMLTALKENTVLDEEEQEQLQEEINNLVQETRRMPLTHEKWETVDALRDRMQVRLDEAQRSNSQALDAATLLLNANGNPGSPLTAEQTAQLTQELQQSLARLEARGGLSGASSRLKAGLHKASTSAADRKSELASRKETLEDLKEFLKREDKKLSECRGKCRGLGSECHGNGAGTRDGDGIPGSGGVSRGQADAELAWGKEADQQGAKFKEVILPEGFLDQPNDDVLAIQAATPTDPPAAAAPRGAARIINPAAGRATWNRRLNPRHRNVVRQFFLSE